MNNKVIGILIGVIIVTIVYFAVAPLFAKPEATVEDQKVSEAILDYAKTQMTPQEFVLPAHANDWRVEHVQINKLELLPGDHEIRKANATISGSYLPENQQDKEKRLNHKVKLNFSIGKKYPEGTSVQLIKY